MLLVDLKRFFSQLTDQRVTGFCVALLVGLSVLLSPLLRLVPNSVIFGVFLYMGVSSLSSIQFFDRLWLLFMPVKHHPNISYVRRVSGLIFIIISNMRIVLSRRHNIVYIICIFKGPAVVDCSLGYVTYQNRQ